MAGADRIEGTDFKGGKMASSDDEKMNYSCDDERTYHNGYKVTLNGTKDELNDAFYNDPICPSAKPAKEWYTKLLKICWKWFQELLVGEPLSVDGDEVHDDITVKVHRRLQLRHALLSEVEGLSGSHHVNEVLCKIHPNGILAEELSKKRLRTVLLRKRVHVRMGNDCGHSDGISIDADTDADKCEKDKAIKQPFVLLPPAVRAYNLAVTDLFVEKALTYLNRKARSYKRDARILMLLATCVMAAAAIYAFTATFRKPSEEFAAALSDPGNVKLIMMVVYGFIKTFTFYGLAVLISVYSIRMAKALFDQSERIKDRRHALRQGRLFVHLNGGRLTIDEMDKAFNWNVTQDNAFSHFNAEAQAPWGTVVKELLLTLRETAKASMQFAKMAKKD